MSHIEMVLTYLVALVGGGGFVKILEHLSKDKQDKRSSQDKLIDQLQQQLTDDRSVYKNEIDSIKKELAEMKIVMGKQNFRITELERENVKLEMEKSYLTKELEQMKGEDI